MVLTHMYLDGINKILYKENSCRFQNIWFDSIFCKELIMQSNEMAKLVYSFCCIQFHNQTFKFKFIIVSTIQIMHDIMTDEWWHNHMSPKSGVTDWQTSCNSWQHPIEPL